MISPRMDSRCPLCGQTDLVQKVSALQAKGTSFGSYTGSSFGVGSAPGGLVSMSSSIRMSGTSQTLLSQQLAPPPMPVYRDRDGCGTAVLVGGLAFVGLCSVLGGLESANEFVLYYYNQPSFQFTPAFIVGIGIGIVCFLLSALCIRNANRRARVGQALAKAELPRWQLAMGRWDRLYYCYRDDVVFVPGDPRAVERSTSMHRLL